MGIDLYIHADEESDSDEISGCWRNLASDIEVLEGLKGCKLFKFIHFDEEEEAKLVDPAKVLTEVITAIKLCAKMPEGKFSSGKAPFLEELDEVKAALEKAKSQKIKIRIECM